VCVCVYVIAEKTCMNESKLGCSMTADDNINISERESKYSLTTTDENISIREPENTDDMAATGKVMTYVCAVHGT
jgi:hypothetical protein